MIPTHLIDIDKPGVVTVTQLRNGQHRRTAGATMAVLTPICYDGFGDAKPAQANAVSTATCRGLTTAASTLNGLVDVIESGPIEGTAGEWTAITGGALVAETEYVVDPNNAGKLITATQFMALTPGAGWQFVRVGRAASSTVLIVAIQAPIEIDV